MFSADLVLTSCVDMCIIDDILPLKDDFCVSAHYVAKGLEAGLDRHADRPSCPRRPCPEGFTTGGATPRPIHKSRPRCPTPSRLANPPFVSVGSLSSGESLPSGGPSRYRQPSLSHVLMTAPLRRSIPVRVAPPVGLSAA